MLPGLNTTLGKWGYGIAGLPVLAAKWARANPRAGTMAWGAGLGAAYGMFSSDTSVLGGAATGFTFGAGGYIGYRAGMSAYRAGRFGASLASKYGITSGRYGMIAGMGGRAFGRSLWSNSNRSARMIGRAAQNSAFFIGRTAQRAWGRIQG